MSACAVPPESSAYLAGQRANAQGCNDEREPAACRYCFVRTRARMHASTGVRRRVLAGIQQEDTHPFTVHKRPIVSPESEFVIDAQSVFDAIAVTDVCTPTEQSLKLALVSIRHRMEVGIIKRLWWCDTREMLADALTKGSVNRSMLQQAMMKGVVRLEHKVKQCRRLKGACFTATPRQADG